MENKWIFIPSFVFGLFLFLYLAMLLVHFGTGMVIDRGEILNEEKMCEAIYNAEGIQSHFPYGIKNGLCSSKKECRATCITTMRHYFRDFKKNGGQGFKNFISFSARRYVGDGDRVGKKNWVKNVTYFYFKGDQNGRE